MLSLLVAGSLISSTNAAEQILPTVKIVGKLGVVAASTVIAYKLIKASAFEDISKYKYDESSNGRTDWYVNPEGRRINHKSYLVSLAIADFITKFGTGCFAILASVGAYNYL